MFHCELFSSSIASGANTFAQVTYFTPDNIFPKLVSGMQVSPKLPFVQSVAGVSANLIHIRLQANSMLPLPYLTLSPNNRGSAFPSPPRLWDFSLTPIPLKPTEEFDIFATQNAGAGQTVNVLVAFSDGKKTALPVQVNVGNIQATQLFPGRFFTAHWTASVTLTANSWSTVAPSFDQPLPAGAYALLGARCFSATGLFFRLFPAVDPLWRPGGICVQAYDQMDPFNQRYFPSYGSSPGQGWGVWLQFLQNVPPQVEFFSTSADTAQEGWFDLVYLGPNMTAGI